MPKITNKNDVMRLGERPRSLEGKPNYLDLPFAIKLYYSMSTISYTPWFSYQINMTLIECSRIRKDKTVRLAKRLGALKRRWLYAYTSSFSTRGRHDSTLVSFQHPGLRIVVVRLCPNVYHTSEYVWAACSLPGVSGQIWTSPHFEAIPRRGKTYFVLSRF